MGVRNSKPNIEAVISLAKALEVSLNILTRLDQSSDPEVDKLIGLTKKLNADDLKAVVHVVDRMVQ